MCVCVCVYGRGRGVVQAMPKHMKGGGTSAVCTQTRPIWNVAQCGAKFAKLATLSSWDFMFFRKFETVICAHFTFSSLSLSPFHFL